MNHDALPRCAQEKCGEPAQFRFTWPGKDEAFICFECLPKLQAVAAAISLHVQIQPIDFMALAVRPAVPPLERPSVPPLEHG